MYSRDWSSDVCSSDLNRVGPSKSPKRTQRHQVCHPRQPPTRPNGPTPLLDPTRSNKRGILLQVGFLKARALGAHAKALGQPSKPPGRVGMGLGCPGWALRTVLTYTLTCIQNRAQSVKAKLHIWCNPMETSMNMIPSPTRSHIAYRHP